MEVKNYIKKFFLILAALFISSSIILSATIKTYTTIKKQKSSIVIQSEIILLYSKITKEWYSSLGRDYDLYINSIKNFLTQAKIKFNVISDEELGNLVPFTNKILILPTYLILVVWQKNLVNLSKYILLSMHN